MKTLFDDLRLTMEESIDLTAQSINSYGSAYRRWAIAFSGGKDSSTVATVTAHLIDQGKIKPPEQIYMLYADTRQEYPPLHHAAIQLLNACEKRGWQTKVVCAPIEKRFWCYMLGRGVPPPSNVFRWCTPKLKVEPMNAELLALRQQIGPDENILMLTGVRKGESAARDQRIALSCSKDGGECGAGWFQSMTEKTNRKKGLAGIDTLAPILHWRVCHVWDWLVKADIDYGFPTYDTAIAYGHDPKDELGEDESIDGRTGCFNCELVTRALGYDPGLQRVIEMPGWGYLSPLTKLAGVQAKLRSRANRLRKSPGELRKDGKLAAKQGRYGPIKLDVRLEALEEVLAIQQEINETAEKLGRPKVSIINSEEEAYIRNAIASGLWPEKWDGTEHDGAVMMPEPLGRDGVQQLLFTTLEG